MKIRSPLPRKRGRIEIVPLIDIMFFLLASFMMVSLQMQKVRTVKAALPTATLATASTKPDRLDLVVDGAGRVTADERPVSLPELANLLRDRLAQNPRLPVYIGAIGDAKHGAMVYVLDFVKRSGASHVAMAVQTAPGVSTPP